MSGGSRVKLVKLIDSLRDAYLFSEIRPSLMNDLEAKIIIRHCECYDSDSIKYFEDYCGLHLAPTHHVTRCLLSSLVKKLSSPKHINYNIF